MTLYQKNRVQPVRNPPHTPVTGRLLLSLLLAMLLGHVGCAVVAPGVDTPTDASGTDQSSAVDMSKHRASDDLLFDPYTRCNSDAQCKSGTCREIGDNGERLCAQPCVTQDDCVALPASYCAPASPSATTGYCMPQSAKHCAVCSDDKDCSPLANACVAMPGDVSAACHVDCSLAGQAACPSDYECVPFTGDGTSRRLCQPKSKVCVDALGGFCERNGTPQTCSRSNSAGNCTGQRVCLPSKRYDRCNAGTPQYKSRCDEMDQPGCRTAFSPGIATTKENCGYCGNRCGSNQDCCNGSCSALDSDRNCGACGRACSSDESCCGGSCTPVTTPNNCGWCGNVCPGTGITGTLAECIDPWAGKCKMSCTSEPHPGGKIECYDPDGRSNNGCEVCDTVPPGHTTVEMGNLGSMDCFDTSGRNFSGLIPSDARLHKPAIPGFDPAKGAAPDYYQVYATGGAGCWNDFVVRLTTGGSTDPARACYKLTFSTDKVTRDATVSGSGTVTITGGPSSYSDHSTIVFRVEKTCSSIESVGYTIEYHL